MTAFQLVVVVQAQDEIAATTLMDRLPKKANARVLECFPQPNDYWGNDPDYPREDWRYEVGNCDTNLGYFEWVAHQKDSHMNDSK